MRGGLIASLGGTRVAARNWGSSASIPLWRAARGVRSVIRGADVAAVDGVGLAVFEGALGEKLDMKVRARPCVLSTRDAKSVREARYEGSSAFPEPADAKSVRILNGVAEWFRVGRATKQTGATSRRSRKRLAWRRAKQL